MAKRNISDKELRFAISLPFSASSDAENGRLSASFIRHAPAPFGHAPADALLLPQATNTWAPTSLVPRELIKRFNVTLCTFMGAPKMASFSNPPAGLWPAPSRHSYKCTFPQLMFTQLSVFFSTATTTSEIYLPYFPLLLHSIQSSLEPSQVYWQSLRTVGARS